MLCMAATEGTSGTTEDSSAAAVEATRNDTGLRNIWHKTRIQGSRMLTYRNKAVNME